MRRLLAVSALLALVATMLAASPAQAAITIYACNPNATDWNLEGAWDDGSVLESRTCLQHDSVARKVRTRSQWRARRGGVALSGTDWDLDSNASDGRPFTTYIDIDGVSTNIGVVANYPDVYNTSIVTLYSNWACYGSAARVYIGVAFDVRATPPGLDRSGYKSNDSAIAIDNRIAC